MSDDLKDPTTLTIKFTDDSVGEIATLEVCYPPNAGPILMIMRDGKLQGMGGMLIVKDLLTSALKCINDAQFVGVRTEDGPAS